MKKLKNTPEVRKLHRQIIKWHNDKFDKLTGIKKVNGKLKLFTPEADITYKMKKIVSAIKKAVVHLNILGLLFIVACGEDNNPTGNNNPPATNNDSLVFSIDSLGIYGSGIQDKDTTIAINAMSDSIKLTFTLESNCDTSAFATGEVGNIAFTILNNLNTSYSYSGKISSSFNAFRVYFNSSTPKYLRFKNIKLYKINHV